MMLKELLAQAKAKPETITFASAARHIATPRRRDAEERGRHRHHLRAVQGTVLAIQDLMGGQVAMMFDTTVVAAPQISKGGGALDLALRLQRSASRGSRFRRWPRWAGPWVRSYFVAGNLRAGRNAAAVVARLEQRDREDLEHAGRPRTPGEGLGDQPSPTPRRIRGLPEAEIAKVAELVKGREREDRLGPASRTRGHRGLPKGRQRSQNSRRSCEGGDPVASITRHWILLLSRETTISKVSDNRKRCLMEKIDPKLRKALRDSGILVTLSDASARSRPRACAPISSTGPSRLACTCSSRTGTPATV